MCGADANYSDSAPKRKVLAQNFWSSLKIFGQGSSIGKILLSKRLNVALELGDGGGSYHRVHRLPAFSSWPLLTHVQFIAGPGEQAGSLGGMVVVRSTRPCPAAENTISETILVKAGGGGSIFYILPPPCPGLRGEKMTTGKCLSRTRGVKK